MNKLQRYHYIELANTYLEDAIPNDKVYCRPKDVSALEAENERLREALAGFLNWSSGHGHYELNTLRREGLDILNREQEKQP